MIKKSVLQNNIVLITEPVESSNTVAIGFYFAVGSRFEGPGRRGISHFCEHLLFKGTSNRSRRDIALTFDRMGGMVNAFTERDDVCMYCVIPSSQENVFTALNSLSDMAYNCNFPVNELEKERSVVCNEISVVEDDSEESALDALAATIWKGSPLSQNITGTVEDVMLLSREAVEDWYDTYFRKGELTVFVTGSFDVNQVENILKALPERKPCLEYPKALHTEKSLFWNSGVFHKKSSFAQTQMYQVYPFEMPLTCGRYYALLVLNSLFGDTMSSRLFESLREQKGLCYSVYSFFSCYEDVGIWASCVSCDLKSAKEASHSLIEEYNLLLKGISDSEIEAAKEHLCGEEIMGGEDVEYVMKRLARNLAMGLPLLTTEETVATIRKVPKCDIIDMAHSLIESGLGTFFSFGKKNPGIENCISKN